MAEDANDEDDLDQFDDVAYLDPHPGIPQQLTDMTSTIDWHGAPDMVLQRLADWAERVQEGISLTLVTGGGLLSGLVITPQDFFRGVSDEFLAIVAENDGPDKEEVARRFVKTHFSDQARFIDRDLAKENKAWELGDDPGTQYMDRVMMRKHI